MAFAQQAQRLHWKDAAIAKAEAITDAWEVTKTWAGRLAEWVLFLCMICNIIEILPGVALSGWFSNTVLGVQAVTLDIAGFSLATMAEQAMQNGETSTARSARRTAYLLIGLMLITVLSVSLGTLWPSLKAYTDLADRGLILVRVGMTVVYGHVVHNLRRSSTARSIPMSVLEERLEHVATHLAALQSKQEGQLHTLCSEITEVGQQIKALPTPEPLNYVTLAERIAPLLPQPEAPDMTPLMEQIALLLDQGTLREAQRTAQDSVNEDVNQEAMIVDIETYRQGNKSETEGAPISETDAQRDVTLLSTKKASRSAQPVSTTNGRGEARQKALRLLKKQPQLTAGELAKRAGITRQYASKLLTEVRSEHNVVNQ